MSDRHIRLCIKRPDTDSHFSIQRPDKDIRFYTKRPDTDSHFSIQRPDTDSRFYTKRPDTDRQTDRQTYSRLSVAVSTTFLTGADQIDEHNADIFFSTMSCLYKKKR